MTYIDRYLTEVIEIANRMDHQEIQKFADAVNEVRENGGRIFFAGVGGSAGNCSHAVNDFRKIVGVESYAITDNVSELTARINDDGWETCFSKWLEGSAFGEKDALVVFSVGGGSKSTSANIVHAIDLAVERGAKVLSIVSRDGGHAKQHGDVCVLVPVISQARITPHAEEWQAIIWHLIVNMIPWRYDGD
jgi:D-sedoheptulose 7-phosphate isomerase